MLMAVAEVSVEQQRLGAGQACAALRLVALEDDKRRQFISTTLMRRDLRWRWEGDSQTAGTACTPSDSSRRLLRRTAIDNQQNGIDLVGAQPEV